MPEYLLHTEALISGQFAFQNTESHLCLGQRGIQLMRHIADELPLPCEHAVHALHHGDKRVAHPADFIRSCAGKILVS